MENVCIYDGTLDGLFTAAFILYRDKTPVKAITASQNIQYSLDINIINIETDYEKSQRIKACVLRHTGSEGMLNIRYAFASENENKGNIIYNFLTVIFDWGGRAPYMLNDNRVIAFFDVSRAVSFECHKMLGFIHFKECRGGFFYADYTPDSNITEFIISHFKERFVSQQFIIHDVKRNIIGIYNGRICKVFKNSGNVTVCLSESEENFFRIWKMYCNTISVKERKNLKLQKRFMPLRYWKMLPETKEDAKP